MLEYKLKEKNLNQEDVVCEPLRDDLNKLYGNINLYQREKNFASGKCCMCCN